MKIIATFYLLIVLVSCKQSRTQYISPPGYDLLKPYIINLPPDADEISGLSYYAKDKSVFAICDEKGILFKITPGIQTRINTWKFSKKADFEDIVLRDSIFYILKSYGTITLLKFGSTDSLITRDIPFPYGDNNEFETLYYNDSLKKFILICKDCDDDKKKALTTFTFDPATLTFSDSSFSIDVKGLAEKMDNKKFRLKPSAAAVNPITGDLFVVSSINKLLIVLDHKHNVKDYYRLPPGLFKQPEGLTFSDKGKLIISNESAKVGTANLLIYNYAYEK